jgi:uncharacterized protein YegL
MGGAVFDATKTFAGKTMICIILDRSGSMQGRESDVVGGVNSFIVGQQTIDQPACLALVRFDSQAIERFREMQDLKEVKPIMAADFVPRGGTPLLDALGQTINTLEEDWRREKPERAIVVVVTDGYENASHEFTKAKIKEMIEARQASGMWAFIYLGADVDAFAEGASMGFSESNTAGFTNTSAGIRGAYGAMSKGVSNMRASGVTHATNLNRNIGENDDVSKPTTATNIPPPHVPNTAVPPAPDTVKPWTPPNTTPTASATWTPPT